MEYTENTKLLAAPTHRHTFRRHYPATTIPPPGLTRLRWWCTKTVNRDFLLVQPTTEVLVHKTYYFSFQSDQLLDHEVEEVRTEGEQLSTNAENHQTLSSALVTPRKYIIRFEGPCPCPLSHQGKYIIRLEGHDHCLHTKRQGGWWQWWGGRPWKVQTFLIHIED